ncbi:MAG: hypothetical protein ACD_3C00220G0005 [uncultured bacterium (gcode 4)]|uniref:Uncharacterized protein n=1 Tax=uncultured bacterium (gcode 4) TaxID=1234023 RepID=K2GB00_9BACT|nr:MAG: hypothetical protein ACD_3C00220G0005 [uncultured bacterium (gcode 4)]
MSKSIHPVEIQEIAADEQLVFLAWPIRWISDWRKTAMEIIEELSPWKKLVFASPDRVDNAKLHTEWNEDFFSRQRNWEQYYLRQAIQKWVVLFWLGKQDNPLGEKNGIQKKSYWAITHIELWQIMVTHSGRLIVWIDSEYNERSTIINDLQQSSYLDLSIPYDHNQSSDFPVESTLEATCFRTSILLNS